MNQLKTIFTTGTIIALAAIIVLIYMVANRQPATENSNTNLHGTYNISNEQLGFKFDVSDEYFGRYQEQHQGYSTLYLIPTPADKTFKTFTPVFRIIAIPIQTAKKFKQLCDQNRQTAPIQCLDYENADGQNNQYYFFIQGSQESDLLSGSESDARLLENISLSVKDTFKGFDVEPTNTLKYSQLVTDGYEFTYPVELDRSFEENIPAMLPAGFKMDFASTAPGLAKVIPVKYCGPSGQCQKTTTNFAVTIGSLEMSEAELLATELGKSLTKTIIDGNNVYAYNEGAEGEGINYNFVISPLDNQVVVVAHRYIDESVVKTYAYAPNFTSFVAQQRIVLNILRSLTFMDYKN